MKNKKNKKTNRIKLYIKITLLILITVIGCYGIIKAPKSDKDILEKELAENEIILQQTNQPQADTSAPAQTAYAYNTNEPEADQDITAPPQDKTGKDISVIGDSVFLGASPSFMELYKDAIIDAKVSRQVRQGLSVAKELNKNGSLGSTVIISLGTNGNFNEATGQELIDYLGADRTIYWINAYGKKLNIQDEVNKTINKLADENDNVYVIQWAKKAKKHSDWFYQDGIHLNTEGQKGFAKFVSNAISGG